MIHWESIQLEIQKKPPDFHALTGPILAAKKASCSLLESQCNQKDRTVR
jgi:hypothetical protein